ncbi:MAG TPA: exosortase/archaeosortase family protein [Pseudomonadales bacterium]|nr:exosortase/archaeosortase family protein [Pseudomonadales bacterium]
MDRYAVNEPQPIKNTGDFWQDTADCWQRLPNKGFFFILLAVWLLIFQFLGNSILGYVHTHSLYLWIYDSTNVGESDDAYCDYVPFLVIGLFWWKRHELLDSRLEIWGPGLAILIFAMLLHIFGYAIQLPHFSILALFVGIYGLMGMAWGKEWLRKSIFPSFLLLFAIPIGAHVTFITSPLRIFVTWLVEMVSHCFGIGVARYGTELFDPSGAFQYDVAAACSGIRSFAANFLLATIYAFFTFRSPWKRLLIISLALPFAILGNLLRLLMVIVAAEMGGQKWGNYVHDNFFTSLMPYAPAFIGLFLVGSWLEKHEARAAAVGQPGQTTGPGRQPAQFQLEKGAVKPQPNE